MDKQPLILLMPCMDMIAGRVVKGVKFVDIKDAGDPNGSPRLLYQP